jgi:hypothetical protein
MMSLFLWADAKQQHYIKTPLPTVLLQESSSWKPVGEVVGIRVVSTGDSYI